MFAATLRHNMRHAGAVRLDHVMGLQRLFWIPAGAPRGRLCALPFADLARIIALESERHRCLVIGEDLGTVPRGFRPATRGHDVVPGALLRARAGRRVCSRPRPIRAKLVSVSTHDLPTLRGFWTARDVRWRELLGRFPDQAALLNARAERARPGSAAPRLRRVGLLPAGIDPEQPPDELSDELAAVHRYLAATPGSWSWSSWRMRSARRSSRTCPAPSSMPTGAAGSGAAWSLRACLWSKQLPQRWLPPDAASG